MSDALPPHNPEAERAVLGCILLEPVSAVNACAEAGVDSDWFFELRHRLVWDTIALLERQGKAIDLVTMNATLGPDLTKAGGLAYLSTLADGVPSVANLPHYLQILEDFWRARSMVKICAETTAGIYQREDLESVYAEVEKRVLLLAEKRARESEQKASAHLPLIIDGLENYRRGHAQIRGVVLTGLEYPDKLLGGLGGRNGNFIVLSARPGLGKTSLATDIALHVALDQKWFTPKRDPAGAVVMDGEKVVWEEHMGMPVMFFSLEMSGESLVERMLFQRARADMQRWRTGFGVKDDEAAVLSAVKDIKRAPIFVDDLGRCTIEMLKAKARRAARQHGIKFFIIDYIQLLKSSNKRFREDRVQELAEISGEIQAMAKELRVPFLVLAQMNRDYEKDPNREPRLSDLKDCGAIEQDADVVGFLHRVKLKEEHAEEYEAAMVKAFGKDWSRYPDRVNLLVAKNRHGPSGTCELLFQKSCTHFLDWRRWRKDQGLDALAEGERRGGLDLPTNEELGL